MKDLKKIGKALFKKECKDSCILCDYGLSDILRAWIKSGEMFGNANHWNEFYLKRCEGRFKKTKIPKFLLLDFKEGSLAKEENFNIFLKGIEVLEKTGPCPVCISSSREDYEKAMKGKGSALKDRWHLLENMSKKLGENISRSDFWKHRKHLKKDYPKHPKIKTYDRYYRCTSCSKYIKKEDALAVESSQGTILRCPKCKKQLRINRRTKE